MSQAFLQIFRHSSTGCRFRQELHSALTESQKARRSCVNLSQIRKINYLVRSCAAGSKYKQCVEGLQVPVLRTDCFPGPGMARRAAVSPAAGGEAQLMQ